MIDRYSLAVSPADLGSTLAVDPLGFEKSVFNAFPTRLLPVITQNSPKGLSHFYWGVEPQWAKNKPISEKLINVRVESLLERASTRKALMRYRCVVPADGFYVWKRLSKKSLVPYRVVMKNRKAFAMAGLWEEYENEEGATFHTFTVITGQPNAVVFPLHDRMPLVLSKSQCELWLATETSEKDLLDLLVPYPSEEMDSYPVSPRIQENQPYDSSLILPAPPADQFGNLTLFS
jgi:putative SOS response-associated peptidase YedK